MDDYASVPKSEEARKEILKDEIKIEKNVIHHYTIEFKYEESDEDQSADMGKILSGNLMIEEGHGPILVKDFGKTLYPNAEKRTDFTNVDEEGAVHIENGDYTEDGKTVYYWTGNVNGTEYDNWVKFGQDKDNNDLWWRIIRTNEDGSLRLLYHGTVHTSTQAYINPTFVNGFTYNDISNNTIYVGYMFGTRGSLGYNRSYQINSSTIKQTIDKWYQENLEAKGYDKYISKTAIYCNDRSGDNYNSTNTMYYATYYRLAQNEKNHPTFKCGLNTSGSGTPTLYRDATTDGGRISDMFSVSTASGGNGLLTEPIALMTADEIVYAGGIYRKNSNSYYNLNSINSSSVQDKYWWTMSPYSGYTDLSAVFIVYGLSSYTGRLDEAAPTYSGYVARPVLSLKSCVTLTGNGKSDDPYIPSIDDTCAKLDN